MRFQQLDVIDREAGGLGVDAENAIPPIANVTHRHRKPPRIGARRSKQDGLFRSSTRPPHAPELEDTYRARHGAAVAAGGRTPRCAAGETRARARAMSNTDATMNTASIPTVRRGRVRHAARITRRQVAPAKHTSDAAVSRSPNDMVRNAATRPAIPTPSASP